jgi:hypothetical protein
MLPVLEIEIGNPEYRASKLQPSELRKCKSNSTVVLASCHRIFLS